MRYWLKRGEDKKMIAEDNITLTYPMMYFRDSVLNDEVKNLINSLTDFFNQTNVVYLADLIVSCNEWVNVKNDFGEVIGKKRVDISFPLNKLVRLDVYEDCLKFTLTDDTVYKVKVNKRFFYFFDWENDYYS